MSRRKARENVFLYLYQLEFRNIEELSLPEQKELFLREYPMEADALSYFELLSSEILQLKSELDELYVPLLKGWTLERLPKIDIVLLRIAVYEMTKRNDIPKSVSINEAVVLAKKYSTDDAKGYINGVLGKIEECQNT